MAETMRDRHKFIVQAVNDLCEINPTRSIAAQARNKSESNSTCASGADLDPGPGPKNQEEYVHGWKDTEERVCKVVLNGNNLDRESLEEGFQSCFV